MTRFTRLEALLLPLGIGVVGWFLLTAATGDLPNHVAEGGVLTAALGAATLFAKVAGPIFVEGIKAMKAPAASEKEDGRWQGEMSTMIRAQTDVFREIALELRAMVAQTQSYHADGRAFMAEQRRKDASLG